MAYDGTIPSLSNQIGNDIPQMQENFSLLESAQVVDEGSTADGDYIRYENGWQICLMESDPVSISENDRGEVFQDDNFPESFASPGGYIIPGGITRTDGGSHNFSFNYPLMVDGIIRETNTGRIRLQNPSEEVEVKGNLIVIGRWK